VVYRLVALVRPNDFLAPCASRLRNAVVHQVVDAARLAVLGLLLLVDAASLSVAAHNAGLSGFINRWRMSAFSLILSALMLVIVDFDRGRHVFIQISLQPLEVVIKDLEAQLGQ
jgi:hypothetical protein